MAMAVRGRRQVSRRPRSARPWRTHGLTPLPLSASSSTLLLLLLLFFSLLFLSLSVLAFSLSCLGLINLLPLGSSLLDLFFA